MKRRAFTLVELLVVIGIIGVLISILLPVLHNVRDHSNSMRCAGNMQSLYRAAAAYAADNDQLYPIPSLYKETYALNPYVNISCPKAGTLDCSTGTLVHYLGATLDARNQLMNCPSDKEEARSVSSLNGVTTRNFSYSFNVQLRGKKGTNGVKMYDIKNAAYKIVIVEEQWPNDECAYLTTNDANDVPAIRHLGKSNMGFADGHVDQWYPQELGLDGTQAKPLVDPVANSHYCDLFKP